MSYNTRRTSMGRGTAQVLYHQQSPRNPGPVRGPPLNQPLGGFVPQQSMGSGYQSPLNSQGPKVGMMPTNPAPVMVQPPSVNQQPSNQSMGSGYQSPQNQQGPKGGIAASNPAPSMVQPPSVNQQYQGQQQQQQQQQTPLTPQPVQPPTIKTEAVTPNANEQENNNTAVTATDDPMVEDRAAGDSAADGDEKPSVEVPGKPWIKKKIAGYKVNKKVKRRRQNARLRKILQPKNAIMVLNELKAGIKFSFQEHTNALTQTMFVVNAEVDGKTYTGQGLSKPLAKQNAAENALKALLLERMSQATSRMESSESVEDVSMESSPSEIPMDQQSEASDDGKTGTEDEVPWGSLASFALYKLFTDWQNQGTHVPIPKQPATPTGTPSQVIKPNSSPAPMKKIPEDPTSRHPVMLLNQLKPGSQFKELSREGAPPNLTFTLEVVVDGKSYTGTAKNKKDAKKEAAKAALAGSLNIIYD